MTSTFSSEKSSKVATRVFGSDVFNDLDSSLCYSPSPGNAENRGKRIESILKTNSSLIKSSILEDSELSSQSTPTPTALFHRDVSADPLSTTSVTSEKRVSFAQDDKENRNVSFSQFGLQGEKSNVLKSKQNAELNRLRANNKKSPLRRNLVKMTEATINDVTASLENSALKAKRNDSNSDPSLYQTVNACRKAKVDVVRKKKQIAKSVAFKREQEYDTAKSLQKKVEDQRRQIRAIQRKLTTAHFKEKARKDEAKKFDRLAKLEEEYLFKSKVHQDHQKKLKADKDHKRKMSIDARAKIRRNKLEGEEKLKAKKAAEAEAIFEIRADLYRSRMEAKKANAEQRRKSFQFRAGDARKIREMRSRWREKDLREKQIGYELKRGAAKDVDNYKKQMKKAEINDYKKRNLDDREFRNRKKNQAYEAMLAEHKSYELKWAGERDAEAHRKKMKEERRKSLARRNKESARHAKVMEELRSIALEKEAESYMLKFNAENDVKAYLAQVAEERRKSLQLRGQIARQVRQYEDEERSKAVENALIEGAIQSDCHRDVENYKKQCAERRRKSFQYRRKEARLQRLQEEDRRLDQQKKDEEGYQLDSLAQKDVEEYYKDCQKRRRKSLALRAKEMRQHAEWKKRRKQERIEKQAHTSYLNSLDTHHMALAREKERARKAMDALRAAGCNFKGNPFGDLLGEL